MLNINSNQEESTKVFINFPVSFIPRILKADTLPDKATLIEEILIFATKFSNQKELLHDAIVNNDFLCSFSDKIFPYLTKIDEKVSYGGEVITGVSFDVFYWFCHDYMFHYDEQKTVVFCSFLAIKSIIGDAKFKKTNKKLFFSRLCGFVQNQKEIIFENELIIKYFPTKYYFQKIIRHLVVNWHLSYYADKVKGFWVSFIVPEEYLAKTAHTKTSKFTKDLAKAKKQAIKLEVEKHKANLINEAKKTKQEKKQEAEQEKQKQERIKKAREVIEGYNAKRTREFTAIGDLLNK